MNGIRISRNTSTDTRNPANRKTTPRNFPNWNHSVAPNRLRLSVIDGMKAPIAMRRVAGTREWIWPVTRARIAPGRDARKLTRIATGAMSRLKRNWSPVWLGSSEYGSTRRFGMKTYAEKIAPRARASAPLMFRIGVNRRR